MSLAQLHVWHNATCSWTLHVPRSPANAVH